MRLIGILGLLILLPGLWSAISNQLLRRDHALALLGISFFAGGFLPTDVALISWPMWPSPDRGLIIGLPDCVAIALIGTRNMKWRHIPFKWLFAAQASAIAISILMSTIPMASFFSLWQFGRVFLLYIAVAGEVHDGRKLSYLFLGLAIALTFEAGDVALQKARGVVQASGTVSHQNSLAVMVELILMPLLAVILEGNRRKMLWVGLLAALLILAAGGSRAGLGLALLGVTLTLIISAAHSMTSRKSGVLLLAVLAVVLAVPVALSTLSERFGSQSIMTKEVARDALESSARAISADYPLGVGAGMFVTTSNMHGYANRAGVSWGGGTRAAPVHNAYLLERAELGWLGLFTFVSFLLVPLVSGFTVAFRKPRSVNGGIAAGSVVALFILVLHSFYEYAPVTYECMGLIAVNIGVIGGFRKSIALAQMRRVRNPGATRWPQAKVPDLQKGNGNGQLV